MSETELTPQAREVLDAARAVPLGPDQETIERMNKAVLLATGAAGAAGVASAAGATAGKAGVSALSVKLFVVSATVLAVTGGVGVVYSLTRSEAPRSEEQVLVAAPRLEAPRVEAPKREVPMEPTAPEAKVEAPSVATTPASPRSEPKVIEPRPVAAVKPEPGPEVAAVAPPTVAPEAPGPNDAYTRELALLEQARTKLQARDWNGVLAAMEVHDTEFPSGALNAEAEVLRILSLCEVNRVSEALERSKRLQRTAGRSPALLRLAGSCVEP